MTTYSSVVIFEQAQSADRLGLTVSGQARTLSNARRSMTRQSVIDRLALAILTVAVPSQPNEESHADENLTFVRVPVTLPMSPWRRVRRAPDHQFVATNLLPAAL